MTFPSVVYTSLSNLEIQFLIIEALDEGILGIFSTNFPMETADFKNISYKN